MYAWEKSFILKISNIRSIEMKFIKYSSCLRGFYLSSIIFTERLALFATVVTYILLGNTMTARTIFAMAGYFNLLQLVAVVLFPQALILCDEAIISIKRIQEFLLLEEILKYPLEDKIEISQIQITKSIPTIATAVLVELEKVFANWNVGQLPPTLCELSLKLDGGKLCCLVGAVGSGKSSLVNVLLQELPLCAGTIKLLQYGDDEFNIASRNYGFIKDNSGLTISYASQDPWIFSGTIRENIIFGQVYDKIRYREILRVCSLLRDFQQLPNGDMTIIGDRGFSLSGGQRARVNLARAIYRQADLYLLDDPLSAVDARVARHLFEDCILHFLQQKTRILVTHQLHFLKQADVIAIMEYGSIKEQGQYEVLIKTSDKFNQLLKKLNDEGNTLSLDESFEKNNENNDEMKNLQNYDRINFNRHELRRSSRRISTISRESHLFTSNVGAPMDLDINDEVVETTKNFSYKIYIQYCCKAGGVISLVFLVINLLLAQMFTSGVDYWVSYWTNIEAVRSCLHDSTDKCVFGGRQYNVIENTTSFESSLFLDQDGLLKTEYAIYVYSICLIFCILLNISRSIHFMKICTAASVKLHDEMFFNIIHATMLFFNTNPTGRILNRFSKDIGAVDELLPKAALEALQVLLVMSGILLLITIVNPWMILPIIVIGTLFYVIQIYFLGMIRNIRRLESVALSPVLSHVSTSLEGLSTIRSCENEIQIMLRKKFDQYQNNHTGAWYLSLVIASVFGFVLDFISCIFISCVCFSFILMDRDSIFSGSVGLAISQSLILIGMVQYGIRQLTEVQSRMIAVERIVQYTEVPKESTSESSPPLPKNWLASGQIQMKKVFLSYKKGEPPILKNIDLILEAGWKVGVVGRTGAGKSSLIAALFRLADEIQGDILFDGRNSINIGLDDLRSSISIIPQQPVLFSATLRYNLDPLSKYSDDILQNALKDVELYNLSLDQYVCESGKNFSAGQRQLICLARAILRNNPILILDEATANIDAGTDELIQYTIRSKFSNQTVITIAHRLDTVIDNDRILVMENGRIVEFNSPYEMLFENTNGYFSQMVMQTGEETARKLFERAKMSYSSQ